MCQWRCIREVEIISENVWTGGDVFKRVWTGGNTKGVDYVRY